MGCPASIQRYTSIGLVVAMTLLTALAAASCSSPSGAQSDLDADRLVFFAASSATEAVEELAASFTRDTGIRVRTLTTGSSFLADQIAAGSRANLFLSANTHNVDKLDAQGLVEAHRPLLGNRLAVIVPADSTIRMQSLRDLMQQDIGPVAVADADDAPVGEYARRALRRAGLSQELRVRLVFTGDAREAMFFVERGDTDAGFVYTTDAQHSSRVRVALEVDPRLTGPIVYSLALLKTGTLEPKARRFYDYLQSPQALEVFQRHGFEILQTENG